MVIAYSAKGRFVEAFWVSTGIVALAEMGDKTQLLALILAARFKRPLPIISGILVATVLNHGLAGALGAWITANLDPGWLRLGLGISFVLMGFWTLVPDKIESEQTRLNGRFGVFGVTFALFFIAEMGDKTQLATVALAAHYPAPISVVFGTTIGMLVANVPVVFLGDQLLSRVPLQTIRHVTAVLFMLLGVWTLVDGKVASVF